MSLYERGFEGNSDQDENHEGSLNTNRENNVKSDREGNVNENHAEGNFTPEDEKKETVESSNIETGHGNSMRGTRSSDGTYSYKADQNGNNSENGSNSYTNMPYGVDVNSSDNKGKRKKPRKEWKKAGFGNTVGKAAIIAAVFGIIAGTTFQGSNYIVAKITGKVANVSIKSDQISTGKGSLSSTSTSSATTVTDVSDIVENVVPAIVQVTNMSVEEYNTFFGTYSKPAQSAGSGIIISQDNDYLYIATNNHVVSNSKSLTITFSDNVAVSAELVGTDEQTDLAVIRVKVSDLDKKTASSIKVATLGSSDSVAVGESAVVIGNALGYGQSVTTGVISALNREVSIEGSSGETYTNKLIQTDAAVNPGNSGGALLDMNGEVIGIVSAKYSSTDVEGMGYAIPISSATSVIQSLMKGEAVDHSSSKSSSATSGAYLGINGWDVSSENSMVYGMPQGVYVTKSIDNQPASKAGIKKGDIITSADGTAITSMEELKTIISNHKSGDKVKLVIATRDSGYDKKSSVEVTLADVSQAPKEDTESNNGNQSNGSSGSQQQGNDSSQGSASEFFNKIFGGN